MLSLFSLRQFHKVFCSFSHSQFHIMLSSHSQLSHSQFHIMLSSFSHRQFHIMLSFTQSILHCAQFIFTQSISDYAQFIIKQSISHYAQFHIVNFTLCSVHFQQFKESSCEQDVINIVCLVQLSYKESTHIMGLDSVAYCVLVNEPPTFKIYL